MTCLLGRGLAIFAWKWTLCRGKDSQYSAIFMAFNCTQWVLYVAFYFWLMGNLSVRMCEPKAKSY